jgi:oxysterol-binding protein 1
MPIISPGLKPLEIPATLGDLRKQKEFQIEPSFIGYENGPRKKLKMDADDRPKISLWVRIF